MDARIAPSTGPGAAPELLAEHFAVRLATETRWRSQSGYERVREPEEAAAAGSRATGGNGRPDDDGVLWLDFAKPAGPGGEDLRIHDLSPIGRRLEHLGFDVYGGERGAPTEIARKLDARYSGRVGYHQTGAVTGFGVEPADQHLLRALESTCGFLSVPVRVLALPGCIVTIRGRPQLWFGRPQDAAMRKRLRGLGETGDLEPFSNRLTFQDPVQRRWMEQGADARTSADLALLILLELASTFRPVCREIADLLERAEQGYFSLIDTEAAALDTDALRRSQRKFFEIAGVLAAFTRGLVAFTESAPDDTARWFGRPTSPVVSETVERRYDETLEQVRTLRQDLRASVDMVASTVASKQLLIAHEQEERSREALKLAEEQRQRNEGFMRDASIIACVLLLPALVAGFFGANVNFPGRDDELGLLYMLGGVVLIGAIAGLVIWRRYRTPSRKPPAAPDED